MDATTIQQEYDRLGYQLGWRFMACPEANLRRSHIALITLNPGGDKDEPDHPDWSQEGGSSYRIESWKGKPPGEERLQRQVRRLCEVIEIDVDDLFAGCLVPFRSPSWATLGKSSASIDINDDKKTKAALLFARQLWTWVLTQSQAGTIITMGKGVVEPTIIDLLGGPSRLEQFPSGWGKLKITRTETKSGRAVVSIPHLSRFSLMGSACREKAFAKALNVGKQ